MASHNDAAGETKGWMPHIPLAALAALFSLPLLLAVATAGALPSLGAALRTEETLWSGAPVWRGCAWLPQLGLRAAGRIRDSSSRIA